MKKTIKKLIAVTFVILLVASLFALPASAASMFDKIADVELLYAEEFTARDVEHFIEVRDGYMSPDESHYNRYDIYAEADVTLTSGEVVLCDMYGTSEDGKRDVFFDAYIDVRDYQQAVEQGSFTVPLYCEITLYSSIGVEMDTYSFESEVSFVECYVKNLTPVSDLPASWQEESSIVHLLGIFIRDEEDTEYESEDEFLLDGAVFDIEYPDGTTVRDTVALTEDEDGYEYYALDGKEIYYGIDEEESILYVMYEDFSLEVPIEIIPYPVSEIIIDDVQVSDAFEAESVSFTVIMTDGTTESFDFSFDAEPVAAVEGFGSIYTEKTAEGYPLFIITTKYEGDEYPVREYLAVGVMADTDIIAETEIEGPEQEDTLLARILYKIRMFIAKIMGLLYAFM